MTNAPTAEFEFDWADLAFANKKPLSRLRATFIVAPREISVQRFKQLVKEYLPQGNIVVGLSKEDYVLGYEKQPQFSMLKQATIQTVINATNRAKIPHKIYLLNYQQRDAIHIIDQISFTKIILVNGSWKHSFHTLPLYYSLVNNRRTFELVSPFTDEKEAKSAAVDYIKKIAKSLSLPKSGSLHVDQEMIDLAESSARQSFDHTFQTGAAIGKKSGQKYRLLLTAFNEVIPYQTYALHYGASRELYFSPPNDLNHYDTVHAEIQAIIIAMQRKINLKGSSMFVNLLPCPVCSRALLKVGISEIVYLHDHSDGYAAKLLSAAGVHIRRIVRQR